MPVRRDFNPYPCIKCGYPVDAHGIRCPKCSTLIDHRTTDSRHNLHLKRQEEEKAREAREYAQQKMEYILEQELEEQRQERIRIKEEKEEREWEEEQERKRARNHSIKVTIAQFVLLSIVGLIFALIHDYSCSR